MKFKKSIVFLLLFCLLFSNTIIVHATELMSLSVGSCDAAPGETVSVPISISSNSGFVSMSLSVTYDTSALTLISYEDTGVIGGASHSSHFTSPYVLTWENDTLTSNITSTGTIVYLTFLVSEDAKEQDYSIIVRIPTDGILDANGDAVSTSSAMGTITVSAEHECSFGAWEYYSKTKHVRYCDGDDCDEKEYQNHNWNDGEIIEEPSHDVEGEIEYTCEDCGATKTTEIDPEGHDWSDWTKLNDTQHKRSCSCGEEETESHNWDAGVVTKQPTATELGVRTYTCNDCSATKTESISPNTIVVTGISLNKTSETLKIGDSLSLTATVTPSNATNKNVTWSSSNSSIASVVNGVVTANQVGTATIIATTEDGGFVAQCTVIVMGEKTIVGYKWYSESLRHKVMYSDGSYDMEDCAPVDCVCGRQYDDTPDPIASADVIISNREACPGETVTVDVNISDTPGLASLVLKVSYDQSLLTLINVEYNTSMGGQTVPPASLTSPVTLYWVNGFANYNENGVFATLTFTVSDAAKEGDSTSITVTYNADDVFNVNDENVHLNVTAGKVTVIDYVPGDINGDGVLNNKDVTRFMQYNAGWDVDVNTAALDVNSDGSINNKDVTRLMQYNAGWDVEIH